MLPLPKKYTECMPVLLQRGIEITHVRVMCPAAGRAVSLALTVHWVFNYGIGQLFLPAVDAVGVSGVYLLFAVVCAFTVVFANTQIPETKGKSLDEIEAEMAA